MLIHTIVSVMHFHRHHSILHAKNNSVSVAAYKPLHLPVSTVSCKR